MKMYNEFTDAELIELLKKGDLTAFDRIYNQYSAELYRFAYSILKDEEECTDAIQDVFIWLWQNRGKIQITALRNYLFAAVKFNMARVIRTSKRRAEILAEAPVIEEAFVDGNLELKELKELISQFIEGLPDRARQIFEMSRNQYLSNKEIAEKLGISEKTVENQMTITLKKLKVNLGKMSFWTVLI